MTPTTESPIKAMVAEAERVIASACDHFGLTVKPEQIVLTIQSNGRRKRVLGWFGPERWKHDKETLHEINLSAEFLKVHDMGETLIHELAHAENHALKIRDCSPAGVHNKKFKAMAERLGLVVKERDRRVGYGYTDHGEGSRQFLKGIAFKRELFSQHRLTPTTLKKDSTRLIKIECPACGYVARVTRKWLEVGLPVCPCGERMEKP